MTAAEQVAAHLRAELRRGAWGGRMAGGARLAVELGVGRDTVEAALRQLEADGSLVPQGAGRRRSIAIPEVADPVRPLRVTILLSEPADRQLSYVVDLQHSLVNAGHHARVSQKCLRELGMNALRVQRLYASSNLRVNTSGDVIGVEVAGALKNVLAIAAGIVEGLELGNNAMAALVAQGCSEIRWLAERMGADPVTLSGLSGVGDIMLTCFVPLSRNRTVGVRLGKGESLAAILASSTQVAEGVATASAVVLLARRHRVALPVLTAVARILDGELGPREAVDAVMSLPQRPEV